MASGGVSRASGLVHIARNDAFQHIEEARLQDPVVKLWHVKRSADLLPMQCTHATAFFGTRRERHRRLSLPMYALIIACEHPGAIHEDIRFFSESDRDFGPPFQR
jgi:hypothetical protein